MRSHDEIERKFLLDALPREVRDAPAVTIEQGWLPGSGPRVRLRRERGDGAARYLRTVKTGRGILRRESEEEIDAAEFERLWPATEGCRVHKRRYRFPEGPLTWEVDDFCDRTLVLAEVELPRIDHPLVLPDWLRAVLVREVTDEDRYVNLVLAR